MTVAPWVVGAGVLGVLGVGAVVVASRRTTPALLPPALPPPGFEPPPNANEGTAEFAPSDDDDDDEGLLSAAAAAGMGGALASPSRQQVGEAALKEVAGIAPHQLGLRLRGHYGALEIAPLHLDRTSPEKRYATLKTVLAVQTKAIANWGEGDDGLLNHDSIQWWSKGYPLLVAEYQFARISLINASVMLNQSHPPEVVHKTLTTACLHICAYMTLAACVGWVAHNPDTPGEPGKVYACDKFDPDGLSHWAIAALWESILSAEAAGIMSYEEVRRCAERNNDPRWSAWKGLEGVAAGPKFNGEKVEAMAVASIDRYRRKSLEWISLDEMGVSVDYNFWEELGKALLFVVFAVIGQYTGIDLYNFVPSDLKMTQDVAKHYESIRKKLGRIEEIAKNVGVNTSKVNGVIADLDETMKAAGVI